MGRLPVKQRRLNILLLSGLIWLLSLAPTHAQGVNYALRFYGHGTGDSDRVKIRLDPQVLADVGATDFTLEFWMKANAGENTGVATCNTNDGWITGNIIFDRDVYYDGDHGDYGVALTGGRIAFGVNNGATGTTLCGATNVANGAWHHIAVSRNRTTGELRVYVDGVLDGQRVGPTGDISYRDGRATNFPNSDPYLVIGAEKHDAGSEYPSFHGWLDEVRLSNNIRYTVNLARPTAPFTADVNTLALYHFDEGPMGACVGIVMDVLGASNGVCKYGGAAPAGPMYVTDTPFVANAPTATPTASATATFTPTLTRTPTATATSTNTPTSTSTSTATRTNTPLAPTATATRTNTPLAPTATATRTNTPLAPTATATTTMMPGNYALTFDGVNDVVVASRVIGTSALTVEARLRPAVNNETGLVIVGSDDATGWSLELEHGRVTFWVATNQGWRSVRHSTALMMGQVYHVAATYSAGTARVFVNGVGSSAATVGTLIQGPWLQFGGLVGYPYYHGALDQVRISNIVRYAANFTVASPLGADANTLGLWLFDQGAGQIVNDGSASGNTATLGTSTSVDNADPAWVSGF